MEQARENKAYLPIEDYGIIGDLHTAALVSLQGSIDYMCFPRFDSPTIFCKLLDAEHGGSFSLRPQMKDALTKQLYLPDTNILVTRFFSDEGIAELIDFMPVNERELQGAVIRKISTIRGKINYRLSCSPAFNYARSAHRVEIQAEGEAFFYPEDGQPAMALSSDELLECDGQDVVSNFSLAEHQSGWFVFEPAGNLDKREKDLPTLLSEAFKRTWSFWQGWLEQCTYEGPWQEMIHRSALTLKLLICQEHGSMVAAPTFGLPEGIGTARTWDYRYTWIRDAAFSMHAFLQLGFSSEAQRFLYWVRRQSSEQELQLMFAVDGRRNLQETILDNLEGYKGSKPVRIGNAAYDQEQMDVYGELMETVYLYISHGGDLTFEYWKIIQEYVDDVINNWHLPDHSIWEVRGPQREFLFSRFMCWIAIDRAIRIGNHFSYPFDFIRWQQVRDEIYYDINENFWNEEKQTYVQYKGGDTVDASVLLMPVLGVISPTSERWKKTMEAINRHLRSDVLVHRYLEKGREIDGLQGGEGTFSICSFWYVECLALMGRVDEAKEHFEKILGYANHLGLFAEQIGMKGEHLGNFPQAFTHLALISAAVELGHAVKKQPIKPPSY